MTNPRSAALATLITVGALALTAGCGTRNVDDPTPPGPGGASSGIFSSVFSIWSWLGVVRRIREVYSAEGTIAS